MMPIYTQQASPPQHYQPQQYLSVPYPQARINDDYNYNRNPVQVPNNYYYPRDDYRTQLYGVPTYRGDYQPKPYYFAQPSYKSDDRVEPLNPLDYLHEEILQENEQERENNAFMQDLALYNKQVDSLHDRQQQMQQIEDMYNMKAMSVPEDYEVEQPTDWYDQTAILVDPSTFENYRNDYDSPSNQYQSRPPYYQEDKMVKELRDLKQNSKSSPNYNNFDWQQDEPQGNEEDVHEPEYDDDDSWINWGSKRDVQPKKDYGFVDTKQTQAANKLSDVKASKPPLSTQTPFTTENSKLISKLHKGQKEVVLPRPAAPVRKPFPEQVMKMMKINSDGKQEKSEQTPPIYKTIKQIIDMEQSLSHVSTIGVEWWIKIASTSGCENNGKTNCAVIATCFTLAIYLRNIAIGISVALRLPWELMYIRNELSQKKTQERASEESLFIERRLKET